VPAFDQGGLFIWAEAQSSAEYGRAGLALRFLLFKFGSGKIRSGQHNKISTPWRR
jgi:hypothetical protein